MTIENADINPARDRDPEAFAATPVIAREQHAEDQVTRILEHQAAKLPSDFFLFAAFVAMGLAVVLELSGKSRLSRFVGMWPPALLTMGTYNKLVKLMGSR